MDCLVDTNVIINDVTPAHSKHAAAHRAIAAMLARGDQLYITPQIVIEFRNVATRPVADRGLGQTAAWAQMQTTGMKAMFDFLPDEPEIFEEWEKLVGAHSTIGPQVFDARLVAVMLAYGVTHILTFNIRDFVGFPEVTVVDPNTF